MTEATSSAPLVEESILPKRKTLDKKKKKKKSAQGENASAPSDGPAVDLTNDEVGEDTTAVGPSKKKGKSKKGGETGSTPGSSKGKKKGRKGRKKKVPRCPIKRRKKGTHVSTWITND